MPMGDPGSVHNRPPSQVQMRGLQQQQRIFRPKFNQGPHSKRRRF